MMNKLTDQTYLQADQYKDSSNLDARIQLHQRFSTNKYGWARWVFDRLDLPAECAVLDVGCGPGYLWYRNVDRIPGGWGITLSDFSPGMVHEAQQRLSASERSFRFGVIDAQAIPFPAESLDAVIANHVLFHVPDRAKAFSEVYRVLRPGGRFYASTVGRTHMQELHDLVHRVDPTINPWGGPPPTSFLLENGLDQISQWFSGVTLHRYEDALIVTEAEPLIAYVLSGMGKPNLAGDKLAPFVESVEQELASRGSIHITKDSGMFEALK